MIILGQTTTNLDSPKFLSTKRTGTTVIRKTQISGESDFCTCLHQCVPPLKVFTDGVGTDELKNDWTSFFIPSINTLLSTGSTITAKIINVETGVETTLSDPTYGELKTGNNYYWFKLDWYLVWGNLGFGKYKITITEVGISGNQTINYLESAVYELLAYSDVVANKTVRIYSQHQGKLHHGNDYSNLTVTGNSVPQPFEQQTRLPGRLYAVDPEIDNHHLVLNGELRPTYQVKDQLRPKFKLDLYLLSGKQINKVVFDELFGSNILITDYNLFGHVSDPRDYYTEQYVEVPVKRSGQVKNSPNASALRRTYSIDLDYDYDNVFKTNN